MGNNQPKKYRNFMIGAASAALVASAVAPVASAAEFSDVNDKNTHAPAIKALVEAGVINGYPDGTFQPNKTLTRSDVVKMMGKWLESLDYKVPADYKTNPRFKDHTSKTNDELLKYAALVKDNGVFNGYADGTLGAGLDITRENMAIVLVRAYDAIHKTDLVTLVKETEFDKDVTDLAKAKAEARPYIDVLDYFDITNPVAPQFNPKNTTTRGQFASFLYKTSNVNVEEEADTEAPKLVYTGEKTLNVEYGKEFTAPTVTATDNVDEKVEVTSVITNEAGERLTEIDTKVPGTYKITYSAVDAAGNSAEDVVVTVVVGENPVLEVASASLANAKEVEVKFNKAVNKSTVLNANNEVQNITITPVGNAVNPGSLKGSLSTDGKTLTITAENTFLGDYTVIANKQIKATDESALAEFKQVVTLKDTTRPTFEGVSYEPTGAAKFSFSEPLDETATTLANKLVVSGGTSVSVAQADITVATDGKSFVVALPDTMTKDANYTFTFTGLKDYAGNLVSPNPISATVVKSDRDTTKPTVTNVVALDAGKLQVTFSEKIRSTGAIVTVGENDYSTYTLDKTGTIATFTGLTNLTTGVQSVTIKGAKDLAGLELEPVTRVIQVSADTIAPEYVNHTVETVGTDRFLVVNYNKEVTANAAVTITGSYVDSNSITRPITAITGSNITTGEDNKSVSVKLPTTAGTYTVNLPTGLAKDTSAQTNSSAARTVTFVVGSAVDTTKPTVETFKQEGNKVTVVFDRDVTSATALDVNNYSIDGVTSPFASAIFKGDAKTVELTLKNDVITTTGDRNYTISNVATSSGAVMDSITDTYKFVENVRPTVQSAKVLSANKIEVTFNEALDADTVGNDFELFQGTSTTALAGTEAIDGTNKVVITLDSSLTSLSGLTIKPSSTINLTDVNGNALNFVGPLTVATN